MRNVRGFVVAVLCMVFFLVFAVESGWAPQDGDYVYIVDAEGAVITGYTGGGGVISIPSVLGGYPVVGVGDFAFMDMVGVTAVTFPSSLGVIGNGSFAGCSSLVSLSFLGLVAPLVGDEWMVNTSGEILGHAFASSDFPAPGEVWQGLLMGGYLVENAAPVFGVVSPVNGSTGNLLSLTWSIVISDPEGDVFSWWIECSNGQVNSGSGASNGTKSLVLSGLAYSTTYTVWVNATDSAGSGLYTREWFTFLTQAENFPPVFGVSSPANSSMGNPLGFSWSIPMSDPEGNSLSWSIECSNGQMNSGSGAGNGTKILVLSGLAYATLYKVWVNATDAGGSGVFTRRWYRFTTLVQNLPPVFGVCSPVNGSINIPRSLSWSIPMNDPNGDLFSWTIQCSNGQSNSGSGASNGTKSLSLSGLAYVTTYTVWVNATDPSGSGLFTRRWYRFTTLAQNFPPVLGSPSPVNGSLNVPLSLSWSISMSDPEGNSFSWTIQCSNGQTNSGSGASNGTKTLVLSGLVYATTYRVYVNVTDPGGSGVFTRGWYTLRTTAAPWVNRPPTVSNPSPVNGSTGVNRYPMMNITVGDRDGNTTTVCFWYSTSNNPYVWVKAQQNNSVPANTTVRDRNTSYANQWSTVYWWRVTVDDGHVNVSSIYRFTTRAQTWVNQAPGMSLPSPVNGSVNIPRYGALSIMVSDADVNQTLTVCFWNNKTGSWVKAQQNTSVSPGVVVREMNTSWCTGYSTRYWWRVTVSDGFTNVSEWYSFTTKQSSSSGASSGGEEEVPVEVNVPPVADVSAGAPYQGWIDSEILFNGEESYDPDGVIVSWEWVFGDNTTGTGQTVSHSYSQVGTYTVVLTVTDDGNTLDTTTTNCVITQPNRPPSVPEIRGPTSGTKNTRYPFMVISTDADNDTIQYTINWGDETSEMNRSDFVPSGTAFNVSHQWTTPGKYYISVSATDNQTQTSMEQTIWIGSLNLSDLGYLLDSDDDGVYDLFHNEATTHNTVLGRTNEAYLIDSDGDGTWDYIFDPVHGLASYHPVQIQGADLTMEAVILIIAICGVLLFVVMVRKKGWV